jgi:hypothetical protein
MGSEGDGRNPVLQIQMEHTGKRFFGNIAIIDQGKQMAVKIAKAHRKLLWMIISGITKM